MKMNNISSLVILIKKDESLRSSPWCYDVMSFNVEVVIDEYALFLFLKDGTTSSDTDPIDAHYAKLKTDISVIPKDSEGFKTIQEYAQNTHGETHSSYTLEIDQVFKISRKVCTSELIIMILIGNDISLQSYDHSILF